MSLGLMFLSGCKVEIETRRQADEDIKVALDRYQEIISKEIEE